MTSSALETTCCIGGGGPAGMMLGVLLSRAGVRTIVLEKHRDFLRDFRGDTIHPSTLELMHELGVLDEFLALPHHKAYHVYGQFGTMRLRVADFTRLPNRHPKTARTASAPALRVPPGPLRRGAVQSR